MNDHILCFASQDSIPPELELIYHHLQPQWDSGPVVITPSYKDTSSLHLLNAKLILRQAKYQSFVANGTVEPRVLPVLVDTLLSLANLVTSRLPMELQVFKVLASFPGTRSVRKARL